MTSNSSEPSQQENLALFRTAIVGGLATQQLDRGEQLDRLLQLRVMAGNNAPRKLTDVAYYEVERTNPHRPAGVIHAPLPWDEELVRHWREVNAAEQRDLVPKAADTGDRLRAEGGAVVGVGQ